MILGRTLLSEQRACVSSKNNNNQLRQKWMPTLQQTLHLVLSHLILITLYKNQTYRVSVSCQRPLTCKWHSPEWNPGLYEFISLLFLVYINQAINSCFISSHNEANFVPLHHFCHKHVLCSVNSRYSVWTSRLHNKSMLFVMRGKKDSDEYPLLKKIVVNNYKKKMVHILIPWKIHWKCE